MSITTFPIFAIPTPTPNQNNNPIVYSGVILNASGDKVAFIIQAPKTGTLQFFEWRTEAVTNNPDNGLRLSFQDVDATTGFPDGVQDQFFDMAGPFSANTWQTPSGPMTNDGTGGGTKRSVTKGDIFALVIEFVSFVASDNIAIATQNAPDRTEVASDNWYIADASSGTYSKNGFNIPTFALKYDDATYGVFPFTIIPSLLAQAPTFNTGSTPDEPALRFQVPVACRITGAWWRGIGAGDYDVILYDASSSILASVSIDKDKQGAPSSSTPHQVFFTATVDLAANTTYRLAIKPTSATNITVYNFTVTAAAMMAAVQGGAEFYYSTRTDAGAWSDSTTTRPWIGLLIDGIDVATGGGGGGNFAFAG